MSGRYQSRPTSALHSLQWRVWNHLRRLGVPRGNDELGGALGISVEVASRAARNVAKTYGCLRGVPCAHDGRKLAWEAIASHAGPPRDEQGRTRIPNPAQSPTSKAKASPPQPVKTVRSAPRHEREYQPMPPCELALIWAPVRPTEKERACCNS